MIFNLLNTIFFVKDKANCIKNNEDETWIYSFKNEMLNWYKLSFILFKFLQVPLNVGLSKTIDYFQQELTLAKQKKGHESSILNKLWWCQSQDIIVCIFGSCGVYMVGQIIMNTLAKAYLYKMGKNLKSLEHVPELLCQKLISANHYSCLF